MTRASMTKHKYKKKDEAPSNKKKVVILVKKPLSKSSITVFFVFSLSALCGPSCATIGNAKHTHSSTTLTTQRNHSKPQPRQSHTNHGTVANHGTNKSHGKSYIGDNVGNSREKPERHRQWCLSWCRWDWLLRFNFAIFSSVYAEFKKVRFRLTNLLLSLSLSLLNCHIAKPSNLKDVVTSKR